jgi:hypothetical protein
MARLSALLKETYDEREALAGDIATAYREATIAAQRYQSWERGFLLKKAFKGSFAKRRAAHETAQAKCHELNEQLRLTTLATQIDIEPDTAEAYFRLRDEFVVLSRCQNIWDTLERRAVNRVAERSVAHEAIGRAPVSFLLGHCDLIQWEQAVPRLPNRTGGDMYIYPGFILYRASRQAFALIDSRDVTLSFRPVRFIEDESVPTDTQIIGFAWAKSNKDGTKDHRFRDNYQMPVVRYGSLTFTSRSGLQEEFQISSPDLAKRFSMAWNEFQASFAPGRKPRARAKSRREKPDASVAPVVQPTQCPTEPIDVESAFKTESDKAALLAAERGVCWEYLLAEELLRTKLAALEREIAEPGNTLSGRSRASFRGSRKDYLTWLSRTPGEICERTGTCVSQLLAVCRKSEQPNDPVRILSAANEVIECCRAFLALETQVSLTEPPAVLGGLPIALRGITAWIIGDIHRFCDEIAGGVEAALTGKRVRAELTFTIPPQVGMLLAEMERIKQDPEWLTG